MEAGNVGCDGGAAVYGVMRMAFSLSHGMLLSKTRLLLPRCALQHVWAAEQHAAAGHTSWKAQPMCSLLPCLPLKVRNGGIQGYITGTQKHGHKVHLGPLSRVIA